MEDTVKRKKRVKSKAFKYCMWTYVALWLVATAVICITLWKKLDAYQGDYDAKYQADYLAAQEAANPDLIMDEVLLQFTADNIAGLVEEMKPQILSRFETIEDYKAFYSKYVTGKSFTYEKDEENYSDSRPVYNVYADSVLFAKVSLKSNGIRDEFGFLSWKLDDIVISENNYQYFDVYLKVSDDMKIYINGEIVGDTEYVRGDSVVNELTDKGKELTGTAYGYKVYYAGDMVTNPVIQVLDSEGNDITGNYVMEENELMNYAVTAPEGFKEQVSERVVKFCETYVYHIYGKASATEVLGMMVDGSEAEAILYDIQPTLAWAWMPDTVEILSEEYEELIYYSEDYFSCKSIINIRKADEKQEEYEEFICQWLFKNVNGEWQVCYFILA